MDLITSAKTYLNPKDVRVIVYHKNCHDGMAAAWCAWKILGDGNADNPVDYIPIHYRDPINEADYQNRNVLLLDFSWSREQLADIRKIAKKVIILDHHKSAMEDLSGVEGCFFDISESGASMAFYYFNNYKPWQDDTSINNLPKFIEYVKDRDIWAWNYRNESEPMYYGLRDKYKPWNSSFRDFDKYIVGEKVQENMAHLIRHGRQVMNDQKIWIEIQAGNAEQKLITLPSRSYKLVCAGTINPPPRVFNVMVLELETPKLVSEIAEFLYRTNDVHFTICWFRHKDNKIPRVLEPFGKWLEWWYGPQKYILSFRSNREGVDVSEIAKIFGGGGHEKAAGATIDKYPEFYTITNE